MDEQQLRVLVQEEKLSQREIARRLGTSQNKVCRTLKKLGLKTVGTPGPKPRPRACEYCSGPIGSRFNNKQRNKRWCGRECEYRYYVREWKEGRNPGGDAVSVAKFVRRSLYETRGEECELCGWAERHPVTGRIPVEIHHIGDHGVHTEENLQVLCPNCHSLTPNFRTLNRGNGRVYRRRPPRDKLLPP